MGYLLHSSYYLVFGAGCLNGDWGFPVKQLHNSTVQQYLAVSL